MVDRCNYIKTIINITSNSGKFGLFNAWKINFAPWFFNKQSPRLINLNSFILGRICNNALAPLGPTVLSLRLSNLRFLFFAKALANASIPGKYIPFWGNESCSKVVTF